MVGTLTASHPGCGVWLRLTLQLGEKVGGLVLVKGAGGDEEDVVGVDVAVLGGDGAALDQGQQVALHALRTRVRTPVVP
jgi:pyruvate/2-oxoacid:ferredoxin oxidoreductase beta subunit